MDDLTNKVALVTGGASGIGLALAKTLAQAGARVAIGDIDEGRLQSAASEMQAAGHDVLPLRLDVAEEADWVAAKRAIDDTLGTVQILCNNAGIERAGGGVVDLPLEDWNRTLAVNLTGALLGTQTFVPSMLEQGIEGHVVNTASILGLFPTPYNAPYVSTKFALVGLSEVMRIELAAKRIGVSVICPAMVKTPLTEQNAVSRARSANGKKPLAMRGRPAGIEPAAVAEAALSAILENRFYVMTHPEYRPVVEQRMQRILDSFGEPDDEGYGEDIRFLSFGSQIMKP